MNIGKKMVYYRKRDNLSQEDLAGAVGVTRQTISKWEIGETSPDIKQAMAIAKVFKISLDELVDNNIQGILVNRVSNIERLAGGMIKFFKILGIIIYFIVLGILIFITVYFYKGTGFNKTKYGQIDFICTLDGEQYTFWIEEENGKMYIIEKNILTDGSYEDYDKYYAGETIYEVLQNIEATKKIIVANGGTCK